MMMRMMIMNLHISHVSSFYIYLYVFQIDLQTFLTLTDNDLRELGISTFGARRKMLLAIAGNTGPEVIKLSFSTQLSTKFQLLDKTKIPKSKEVSCFKSLRCGIYHANKC